MVMRRKLPIAGVVLAVILASSVRIGYHKLGWGAYWDLDFVALWHR
jgi:hypothetical protein